MSPPVPVVHGFYRYSDILFEWHQVIDDPAERSALKAFVSSKSLADPSNPLRKRGSEGIDLYMGTLNSGQSRLMFSSAQVEYIRYWLHAMGLTKQLLPLPSSEGLLTESSLRNWSRAVYRSEKDLKDALKTVDKNNRKLKGADSELMSVRQIFERVRTYWSEKQGTWLAIDFEQWERDSTVQTEFGWSCITFDNEKEQLSDGHLIVKEHMMYQNTCFVQGNRDHYNFGKSEIVNKATFKRRIRELISNLRSKGPLFLVFHDHQGDIKSLKCKDVDADIEPYTFLLPDAVPDEGIYIVDTSDLFCALQGDVLERRALEKMMRLLLLPTEFLHNAGNDAHYTLQALKSMASGNQIDSQRNERWPFHDANVVQGQPGPGLKVEFDPWKEDSDYSDMEGVTLDLARDGVAEMTMSDSD